MVIYSYLQYLYQIILGLFGVVQYLSMDIKLHFLLYTMTVLYYNVIFININSFLNLSLSAYGLGGGAGSIGRYFF